MLKYKLTNEFLDKKEPLLFSIITILGLYTLGGFGLLNVFNLKGDIYYPLLILILIIPIIRLQKNIKTVILNPIFILYLYLFFSSILLDPFETNHTIKMGIITVLFSYILTMKIEHIDFIIKSCISITFVFSIIGIILFIYYQFNPELLNGLDRVYRSYDKFTDLSYIPTHQKFGFVIETAEKNLFGIEYIRSRSYMSEPSATLPLFFTMGILSILYDIRYKILGFFILFFSIVLIYSGSAILSLVISFCFVLWMAIFKPNSRTGSLVIISSIALVWVVIYKIDFSLFEYITPESKAASAPSRLMPIINEISAIVSEPFFKESYPQARFIGLGLLYCGVIPVVGIILSTNFFFPMFKKLIESYKQNRIFSALMIGLMIQTVFFSSSSFLSLPGSIILCIVWMKVNHLSLSLEERN